MATVTGDVTTLGMWGGSPRDNTAKTRFIEFFNSLRKDVDKVVKDIKDNCPKLMPSRRPRRRRRTYRFPDATCMVLACTCVFLTRTPVLLGCTYMVIAPVIDLQSRKSVRVAPTRNTHVGCDPITASSIPEVCLQQLCHKITCGKSVAGTFVGFPLWLRSDNSNYVD
jgi:hypothetical protein